MNSSLAPSAIETILQQRAFLKAVYEWLIPVMIVILLVAIFGNCVIVLASPRLHRPVSPYLKLCVSLAAADMWAASLLIAGLVVNSYLPVVLEFPLRIRCADAFLEILRVAGMLTSNWHLFALAMNQFVGILWPLKYKLIVTQRRMRWLVVWLWLMPLLFVLAWFVWDPKDGLRHPQCIYMFYQRFPFRLTIFVIFMVPLFATIVIYAVILFHLLQAKKEFEANKEPKKGQYQTLPSSVPRKGQVSSKLKLVWTTVLIVITFSCSWGACVCYFVLVCLDGCPLKYQVSVSFEKGFFISSTVNCLVMLKLAANPFIYTLRIRAIRGSVESLLDTLFPNRAFFRSNQTRNGPATSTMLKTRNDSSFKTQIRHDSVKKSLM